MPMDRQYHRWFSPSLEREMELLVFGHGGPWVLVFPTSMGRFFDWEDRGLIAAMREHEPQRLEALRRMDIILALGGDDAARANNEYLSSALWSKDILHALRIWDGLAHDWPVWQEMLPRYIGGHD